MRADRLGIAGDGLLLWAETDLAARAGRARRRQAAGAHRGLDPDGVSPDLESAPGSVAQVRECAARLMTQAKGRGLATFLVGESRRRFSPRAAATRELLGLE